MQPLTTHIDPRSDEYRANHDALRAHLQIFREAEQKALDLAESAGPVSPGGANCSPGTASTACWTGAASFSNSAPSPATRCTTTRTAARPAAA